MWWGDTRRLVRGADRIVYDGDPAHAPPETTNVYVVALHGYPGRRDIGVLRLRFRQQVKVTEREEAMLASYAAALDTAVRNAIAYQQLGEATEAHAHAAAHDALTGLANRRELERQLTTALVDPAALEARIAVMLIDLRHFKEVNDALGHLAGDRVLVQVAERLRAAAGPTDLVSRFGGDEFAILLRSAWRPARVEARARRVLRALAEPVTVDGLPIMVEASGGLALAIDPQDGLPTGVDPAGEASTLTADTSAPTTAETPTAAPEKTAVTSTGAGSATTSRAAMTLPWQGDPRRWMVELLRRADVAMYRAKRTGQPLVRYTAAHDPADRDRLALAGQLPRAISQRGLTLDFQPIVDLGSGQVIAAEALARWRHPTRGQLDPRYFLDLLERSAQLTAFTQAVLDEALAAAAMWRAAGHDLRVAVNISARSLLDVKLPRQVLAALDAHHTPPDRLCLELTETLAISQLDTVGQVLTQLHDLGCGWPWTTSAPGLPPSRCCRGSRCINSRSTAASSRRCGTVRNPPPRRRTPRSGRPRRWCAPPSSWGVPSTSPWSRKGWSRRNSGSCCGSWAAPPGRGTCSPAPAPRIDCSLVSPRGCPVGREPWPTHCPVPRRAPRWCGCPAPVPVTNAPPDEDR